MTCISSTPYSRDLGDELRSVRENTPYTGKWLAGLLSWDPSKVSNIENGKVRASEVDLVQYLTVCGRDRDFVNEFLDRYRTAFDLNFVQAPDNLRTMALAESTAVRITSYDNVAVPCLLQTEDYARALLRLTGEADVERAVRFRMERQAILRDREATFYVHENALRLRVGNDEVMEEQILRLICDAGVRVVPAASAPVLASFVLWEYEKADPVVFVETDLLKVFAQDADVVARSRSVFERLDAVALDIVPA